MSRSITLGQYYPGNSLIHRLNARLKIIMLGLLIVLLFFLQTFEGLLLILMLVLFFFVLAGVPFSFLIRGLRPVLYIALFALIIYLFFTKGGVVLLRVGSLTVESDGAREGFFIITRLVVLVLFSLLVTLTTTPLSLTHGIGSLIKPLQIFGLPTDEIAMIMAIALRFIPTLMEESRRLMFAQLSRGADFETGSLFRRAKNLAPLIIPLFVSAFRRADELALAMEARGYRLGVRRTRMHEDSVAFKDWVACFLVLSLLAAALALGL